MSDREETLQAQLDALKAALQAQDFDSLTPEGVQDMLRAFIEDDLGLYAGEGGLLNIILDVLFVVAFHMGVLGVAVATLISQAFSALLVTRKLLRSEGMLKLSFSRIRFHGSVLKNQLKLGLPTGFEAILFAITNIAIQSAVNTFGTDTSAAWSAYGKLDAI